MATDPYQGQLRVRVAGLLVRDGSLLLVKLKSPLLQKSVWMPPGGGLHYGESMEECLIREFREETGMEVDIGSLLHVNELIEPPYHALEFYFEVEGAEGEPTLGGDPEMADDEQILQEVRFIPIDRFDEFEIEPGYLKRDFRREFRSGKFGFKSSFGKR